MFWDGFTKQATSSMTVGRIMEGMAYGLASRAGKSGKAMQEAAEEVIDAYSKAHTAEYMTSWKKSSKTTQEILESMKELNQKTKNDPATAAYMLDFLKKSFEDMKAVI